MRPPALPRLLSVGPLALLLGAAVSISACGDSNVLIAPPPQPDAGQDTAPEDVSPDVPDATTDVNDPDAPCTFRCNARITCDDGTLTRWSSATLACGSTIEDCPREGAGTCQRGCREDIDSLPGGSVPTQLCEENRPKWAGDPCTTLADCLPLPATDTVLGVPQNRYLRCDTDAGVCVADSPPTVPDYMTACGIDEEDLEEPPAPDDIRYGIVAASDCPGDLCLFIEAETCVRQGCTVACTGDHECPPGSRCAPNLTDWSLDPLATIPAVCKPGRLFEFGPGLECP